MIVPRTLLLCHHGTAGAAAAEALAWQLAVPGNSTLVQCLVVPDLWAGIQGDDWLNDASTRDDFGRYVENMLEDDARRDMAGVEARCRERGIAYRSLLRVGDPADCVVAVANEIAADLAIIGPPRPKGVAGLRSRMNLETLARDLPCPLLIARWPSTFVPANKS
jgi:nucleotide-binding universal stress UspA family protein